MKYFVDGELEGFNEKMKRDSIQKPGKETELQ